MRLEELRQAFIQKVEPRLLPAEKLRRAAVLVPIEPGRGVWLTRRSARLADHSGQVAFPGGKIEPRDASAEAAALREAQEEIGLDPGQAEILGRLDDYVTGTGFHVVPVVALLPRGVALTPAVDEVADIFTLPFSTLLNADYPLRREVVAKTGARQLWVWPHPDHVIWGATAAMLRGLAARLDRAAA
ncbi:CoA pyrophosphatase [Acidocella sp.]|uniref:CoA pyrophosphatase n=1 Tax=Acidocella sp. TaxID=50710 RepID=UPI00262D9643|nr:CoA pyrophosphatase [Acidocella sp.]